MQIVETHSHLNGYEWLAVHQPVLISEIQDVLAAVDAEKYRTKISKEKNMKGKALFSPTELNAKIKEGFGNLGWHESRTSYWVTSDYELIMRTKELDANVQKAEIEKAGKLPIMSYNQTDFVKNGAAVEVQFGKYAFIAYDLFVKHLAFWDPLPRECNILGFARGLLNRAGFVSEISALMPEASEDDITDVHTISLAFLAAILLLDVIDGERITTDQLPPL